MIHRGNYTYKTSFWAFDSEKQRAVELAVSGPENKPATYRLYVIKKGQDSEYRYLWPGLDCPNCFYKEVFIVQEKFANIVAAGQEKIYNELEKILQELQNESQRSNS